MNVHFSIIMNMYLRRFLTKYRLANIYGQENYQITCDSQGFVIFHLGKQFIKLMVFNDISCKQTIIGKCSTLTLYLIILSKSRQLVLAK